MWMILHNLVKKFSQITVISVRKAVTEQGFKDFTPILKSYSIYSLHLRKRFLQHTSQLIHLLFSVIQNYAELDQMPKSKM